MYTHEELIEFLNHFDSHWDHGPPQLRGPCRPTSLMRLSEEFDLDDIDLILLQDLPTYWVELAREKPDAEDLYERLYEQGLRRTHRDLHRCVDRVISFQGYEHDPDADLNCIVANLERPFDSPLFEFRLNVDFDNDQVFFSSTHYVTPDFGNYYLAFLDLMGDPKVGVWRIGQCEYCRDVILRMKRLDQRFCSSQCRSSFWNGMKDKGKHATYMRDWRKKLKLQEARLKRKQAKARKLELS